MRESKLQHRVPKNLQAILLKARRGESSSSAPTMTKTPCSELNCSSSSMDSATVASCVSEDSKTLDASFSSRGGRKGKVSKIRVKASNKDKLFDFDPSLLNKSPHSCTTPRRRSIKFNAKLPGLFPPIASPQDASPQEFLDDLLESRGYSTKTYNALDTAYYNEGTPLQLASYNTHTLEVIKDNNATRMQELLSCGISASACNPFNESFLHAVCRRNSLDLFNIMMQYNCSVQVCDDFGKTALHELCWVGQVNFDIVAAILEKDVRLLQLKDSRGYTPLMYVQKEYWEDWTEFLQSQARVHWRQRYVDIDGVQDDPPLTKLKANHRPIVESETSVETVKMICEGGMTPIEVKFLQLFKETYVPDGEQGEASLRAISADNLDESCIFDDFADMKELISNKSVPWSR
jgi:hypothetical protein